MEKEFSPFSLMLVDLARALNEEDQSLIKLLLQANKITTRAELDRMINGAEIIRGLLYKQLITDDNTDLLKNLLKQIGRVDLLREITKYLNENVTGTEELSEDSLPSSQESISDEEKLMKMDKMNEICEISDCEMCSQ